jgi:hypothetical protein
MTEATKQALIGLRDITMLKWYVIPLLAIVFFIYSKEISKARRTRNWDAILAGLTVFGLDFFNETWNGWVMVLTGRSALWTAPGDTGLRMTVGWNIEIIFMFLILGIIYYYSLSDAKDKKLLGIHEKWAVAIGYTVICVAVECVLNQAGMLVWEYPFWNFSFAGIWLILVVGYFQFFVGALIMISLKKMRSKLTMLGIIYAVPIIMNIVASILNWRY